MRSALVDMLVKLDPQTYQDFVVLEDRKNIIFMGFESYIWPAEECIIILQKLQRDLESIGFEINFYNPCIANQIKNGKQQTVT